MRGDDGYKDERGVERLNVLDFQRQIRTCPKPVIAMVAGYAIGGGHVLHLLCDLTIAAENARFGQTGPRVGSFDGGYGASYMARIVGQKKAREIWFLCRQYDAQQALAMGLVNTVVPLERLEEETVAWCREILANSPLAIRCLKAALNADCDGQAGLQELAGNATLLFYMSEEGQEGRNAYLEKRKPDFSKFPNLSRGGLRGPVAAPPSDALVARRRGAHARATPPSQRDGAACARPDRGARVRPALARPLRVGGRILSRRTGLLVVAEDGEGHAGVGEAAPLPGLHREGFDRAAAAAARARAAARGRGVPEGCAALDGAFEAWLGPRGLSPSVRCGIEGAVLSLLADRAGVGVARLLGADPPRAVRVNALLDGEPDAVLAAAARLAGRGLHSAQDQGRTARAARGVGAGRGRAGARRRRGRAASRRQPRLGPADRPRLRGAGGPGAPGLHRGAAARSARSPRSSSTTRGTGRARRDAPPLLARGCRRRCTGSRR